MKGTRGACVRAALSALAIVAAAPHARPQVTSGAGGNELNNTTYLPEIDERAREELRLLEADAGAGRHAEAARRIDALLDGDPRRLVPCGRSLRLSLSAWLGERLRSAPPATLAAWRALAAPALARRVAMGVEQDPAELDAVLRRFPAAATTGALAVRRVDLLVEEGSWLAAARALALLERLAAAGAIDAASVQRRAVFLAGVEERLALSSQWPCAHGSPARSAPARPVASEMTLRALPLPFTPARWSAELPMPPCAVLHQSLDFPIGSLTVVVGLERAIVQRAGGAPGDVDLQLLAGVASMPPLETPPLPFLDRNRLYTVVGPRPKPRRERGEAFGHALVGIELVPGRPARRLFALTRDGMPVDHLTLDDEDKKALAGPLGYADGMVARDGRLWVAVSHPADHTKVQVYLACLDALSGRPLWITFLCQGAPLSREPDWNRQEAIDFPDTPPAPLALHGGTVLVGTNLGVLAAVDATSGEYLWAWRYERIPSGPRNPSGWPRNAVRADGDRVLLAPTDATRLYDLFLDPHDGRTEAHPPRDKGKSVAFVGAAGAHLYFLHQGLTDSGLVRIDRESGRRFDAVPLQSGEHVIGEPLLLRDAIWLCTDRHLYRFDLARDLLLDAVLPIDDHERAAAAGTPVPVLGGLVTAGLRGVGSWLPERR